MASRIKQLSIPKPNLLRHVDRRSVYCLDELPSKRTGPTTSFELTPRWSQLCRSKTQAGFDHIRDSPTWVVSKGALNAQASHRLCALAQPRCPAMGWQPDRLILVPLSRAVQNAVATPRICQLATPKRRHEVQDSTHELKTAQSSYKQLKVSSRIELLSTPKKDHPEYTSGRPVSWPVPRAACNAVASKRVVELSRPKERKALFEGYNPYIVSQSALSAQPSPRLQELCLPLPHKCKTKLVKSI